METSKSDIMAKMKFLWEVVYPSERFGNFLYECFGGDGFIENSDATTAALLNAQISEFMDTTDLDEKYALIFRYKDSFDLSALILP